MDFFSTVSLGFEFSLFSFLNQFSLWSVFFFVFLLFFQKKKRMKRGKQSTLSSFFSGSGGKSSSRFEFFFCGDSLTFCHDF